MIVLCSFISPFRAERRMVREQVEADEFVEIFVDTPLEVCIRLDPKGLYARAIAGKIKNFTGIDSPYERPEAADIVLRTVENSADESARRVIAALRERSIIH
jgi:bifunctional enzyme CysN/CysC